MHNLVINTEWKERYIKVEVRTNENNKMIFSLWYIKEFKPFPISCSFFIKWTIYYEETQCFFFLKQTKNRDDLTWDVQITQSLQLCLRWRVESPWNSKILLANRPRSQGIFKQRNKEEKVSKGWGRDRVKMLTLAE